MPTAASALPLDAATMPVDETDPLTVRTRAGTDIETRCVWERESTEADSTRLRVHALLAVDRGDLPVYCWLGGDIHTVHSISYHQTRDSAMAVMTLFAGAETDGSDYAEAPEPLVVPMPAAPAPLL